MRRRMNLTPVFERLFFLWPFDIVLNFPRAFSQLTTEAGREAFQLMVVCPIRSFMTLRSKIDGECCRARDPCTRSGLLSLEHSKR